MNLGLNSVKAVVLKVQPDLKEYGKVWAVCFSSGTPGHMRRLTANDTVEATPRAQGADSLRISQSHANIPQSFYVNKAKKP